MFTNGKLIGLYAETPLHPGSGVTTGVVDLPVQRERHTNYPIIQSSSLKGSFRTFVESKGVTKPKIEAVFGPEDRGDEHAGSITFTDARILLFPIRSFQGIFVWITCPNVLARLKRDLAAIGITNVNFSISSVNNGQAFISDKSDLASELVLEEYTYNAQKNPEISKTAEWIGENLLPVDEEYNFYKQKLSKHLMILSDDDFKYLVETATEVTARIVLNDTKTSENLWYEEFIPSDTLFYTILLALKPRAKNKNHGLKDAQAVLEFVTQTVKPDILQVGGDETIGRGWVRVTIGGGAK